MWLTSSISSKLLALALFSSVLLTQPSDGYFFGLFESYYPTDVIAHFRQLITNSKEQLKRQISSNRDLIRVLSELKVSTDLSGHDFTDVKSSYKMGLKLGKDLVKKLKEFDKQYQKVEATSTASMMAADDVLLRLKELMQAFSADVKDLPPTAFEIRTSYKFDSIKVAPKAAIEDMANWVTNFQEASSSIQKTTERFIDSDMRLVSLLLDFEKFAIAQEKQLDEIASSFTALLMDIPNLYGRIETAKRDVVNYLKKLNILEIQLRKANANFLQTTNEAINQLRNSMFTIHKYHQIGSDRDLLPTLDLIVSKRLVVKVTENLGEEGEAFNEGVKLKNQNQWRPAYRKFKEAWKKFNESENQDKYHTVDLSTIIDHLQMTASKIGKLLEARWLCEFLIDNGDLNEEQIKRFQQTIEFYSSNIRIKNLGDVSNAIDSMPEEKKVELARELVHDKQYNVCNGPVSNEQLHCQYNDRNRHPLLILSPVKEEIIHYDPLILVFHDVVLEKEMDLLKTEGNENQMDTEVIQGNGTIVNYNIRKSTNAHVFNRKVDSLIPRIEAITGLDPNIGGCENYVVSHYKIGGHYLPHYDTMFLDISTDVGMTDGDRIATLLLYLNEVEEGGATFFKYLNIKVEPEKGAGLFWFNILKNETVDSRTMHGGCPVVKGEKWITNKWFRFRGQFQHNPCGKTAEELYTIDDLTMSQTVREYSNYLRIKALKEEADETRILLNNHI